MSHRNILGPNFVATSLMLFTVCNATFGQGAPAKPASATPLMALLNRFTAADTPALGPAEIEVPAGRWMTNAPAPVSTLRERLFVWVS